MRKIIDTLPRRTTSTLNDVTNDTGRVAFCGPVVISAITGQPVSAIEARIHAFRDHAEGRSGIVKGTYTEEVEAALAAFDYRMVPVASYMHLDRKMRPTLWGWMQRPRNAWAHYILAVHKGREGHWILVRGVKICDTYTGGKWKFVCEGPHRGARIMEVHEVRKALPLPSEAPPL